MALYRVEIHARKTSEADQQLRAIAGIVGKPVTDLKADKSGLPVGVVRLVVEGDHVVARNIQGLGCVVRGA